MKKFIFLLFLLPFSLPSNNLVFYEIQEGLNIEHKRLANLKNEIDNLEEKIKKGFNAECMDSKILQIENAQKDLKENLLKITNNHNKLIDNINDFQSKINDLTKTLYEQNKKINSLINLKDEIANFYSNDDNFILYQIHENDSLEKIAKKFKISIEEIKKKNNLKTDLIKIGQKLKIPNN